MTPPGRKSRITRRERLARRVLGMPAGHPELLTRKPDRAEWALFATWCAQLWPCDEYTQIAAQLRRENGS